MKKLHYEYHYRKVANIRIRGLGLRVGNNIHSKMYII